MAVKRLSKTVAFVAVAIVVTVVGY